MSMVDIYGLRSRVKILLRSARELIRHFVNAADIEVRPGRVDQRHLVAPTLQERFSSIYRDGIWKRGSAETPGSGEGSTLDATKELRASLPEMLNRLDAKILLDLGCGDFTWMRTLSLSQHYVGVDVVPAVVASNNQQFGRSDRAFFCLNIVTDDLPEGDIVLCREILFHLSFSDALSALRNCGRRSRRYLLATTDNATLVNADILSGDFRVLNLRRPPFSFPPPDFSLKDDAIQTGRTIGVWRWERIPFGAGNSK